MKVHVSRVWFLLILIYFRRKREEEEVLRLERENFEREAAREAERIRLEMEERLKREEEERLERKRRVEAIMSRTRKTGPETTKYVEFKIVNFHFN